MNYNNSLNDIDWSFSSLSNSGIHSVHWYPATYVSAIPGTLIPSLVDSPATVLDPFCGSGTTGVEALKLGNKFIGMDTNPIALLISESKLYLPDDTSFRKTAYEIVDKAQANLSNKSVECHPQFDELKHWYHPHTLHQLSQLLSQIIQLNSQQTRRCFLGVFSSILKNTSSQTKHWGWVCDNVKPKPGEIVAKDAFTTFLNHCKEYIKSSQVSLRAIKEFNPDTNRRKIRADYSLIQGDCVSSMKTLEQSSIDLIMTSPPYYGVADYIKSQRLSYLWFDIDELNSEKLGFKHFEKLRTHEKGSRAHRHRANSRQLYIDFISQFFAQSSRVLKQGAYIALVVGESKAREATTESLIECASNSGFELKLKQARDIKATRRRLMAKVKGEDVLIFKNT